jgi:hypothetical protein
VDPGVIGALIPVVAIIAVAAVKIARVMAARPQDPSSEVLPRLDALEGTVEGLQHQLLETQERLDFAERLLTKARDEHRV